MSSSIRRERYPIDKVCQAFGITRSTYYDHRSRSSQVDTEREALKQQVKRIFHESRGSAGTRTIKTILAKENVYIGRFLIGRLMSECHLSCKQPGPHRYKVANTERPDIPNKLNREFHVDKPNRKRQVNHIYRSLSSSVILSLY